MTAPTFTPPAAGDAGQGGTGQAPETNPAGPGDTSGSAGAGAGDGGQGGSREGDGPRGRRAPDVRSSSRDDDGPQDLFRYGNDGDPDGDGDGDRGRGRRDGDDRGRGRDRGDRDGDGDGDGGKRGRTPDGNPADWRIEDFPEPLRKHVKELRAENASRRTEAADAKKRAEQAEGKAKAGDERYATAIEGLMKTLGLTPEVDEPQRSPEEQISDLSTKYQQTRIELAVYRAAAAHGGDPDALLDSRGFMTSAHALDPAADSFTQDVAAAIKAAVEANPKLRAAAPTQSAAAAPSGGDFGGGPAEPRGPEEWSIDDYRRNRNQGRGN